MIASVSFRNFKALRSTSLKLAPFNLLVGPTGSGKTSLIQALLRLRALSHLPLAGGRAVEAKAGRPRKAAIQNGPEIAFLFSPPNGAVEADLSCVADIACDVLRVQSPDPAGWEGVRGRLARVRAYLLDHYAMGLPSPRASGAELASNGSNLAAVLAERRARHPAAFAEFEAEALRLLPEFAAFDLRPAPGDTVELAGVFGDGAGRVSAENLSEGALYTLAILALAFDPDPPSVVCFEELDRGIHPRLLRDIRDAFYRLSYPDSFGMRRPAAQVIATTHSPYLLDLFRDHPEEVVITQKQGRVARFERLADRADLNDLLREGSLGDLWFSGILGGVPEEKG